MRFAAAGHDAEFQIVDEPAAQSASRLRKNVRREREQLPLPGVIFDFDDQAGAHQFRGAGMGGDFLADGFGPRGAASCSGVITSPDSLRPRMSLLARSMFGRS